MTDQDLDGSHIKGLGINLFQCQWNQLSKLQNFIGFMNTPILKARKNNKTLLFYHEGEYENGKRKMIQKVGRLSIIRVWARPLEVSLKNILQTRKLYISIIMVICDNAVDMVFNKKRADDRKNWLGSYDRKAYLDTNCDSITYSDFINKEMIHFSKYDCERSIPNIMDGLKNKFKKNFV